MKIIIIEGGKLTSKSAAHEYIASALNFPMYYGKNLDALADCLSELPRDTMIVLRGIEAARDNLGYYADQIFDVFDEFAKRGAFKLILGDMDLEKE